MFTKCSIKLINDHIVIDDNQKIIIDTGSPISFNPSGFLVIGENRFVVPHKIPHVSLQYLSEKVGCEIEGLLGMDVMNKTSTLISLKNDFLFLDDDTAYPSHFQMYPLSILASGLIAITISVNHQNANLLVDSGAPISYIGPKFLNGLTPEMTKEDFSPFIGEFMTDIYMCEIDFLENTYANGTFKLFFGIPPKVISMTLAKLNIDGIIGVDLFKQFRLQLRNGVLHLPPQGI